MTNADRIREMTNDELVNLLIYGYESRIGHVPKCNDNCKFFHSGCILDCSHDRREKSMIEWLKKECD